MDRGIVVYVYKRITFFNRQKWAFRIIAANGKTLAHSEKYTRKQDAVDAAELILHGPVRVDVSH